MTRKEIAWRLTEEIGVPFIQAFEITRKMIDIMVEGVATEGMVQLRNFGSFTVARKGARVTHNPKTKEEYHVPPVNYIKFKPSARLRTTVKAMDPHLIKKSNVERGAL